MGRRKTRKTKMSKRGMRKKRFTTKEQQIHEHQHTQEHANADKMYTLGEKGK